MIPPAFRLFWTDEEIEHGASRYRCPCGVGFFTAREEDMGNVMLIGVRCRACRREARTFQRAQPS